MSMTPKYLMGVLSGIGLPGEAAQFFYDRCNHIWGGDQWNLGANGVEAGGKLVMPKADFALFLSGMPYGKDGLKMEAIRIEPVPETGDIDPNDPLCCQLCGRRVSTANGLAAHMRLRHKDTE